MRAPPRKNLLIAGGVVALGVIAAIVVISLFDINKLKSNIETAVFDATGLEVSFNGKMELAFFPFGIVAQDIQVANRGGNILSIDTLKLETELLPLLKKQFKVTRSEFVKPVFTIVKDVDGRFNYESLENKPTKGQPGAAFSLGDLKVSNGVLVYLDEKTGEKIEYEDFNLMLKNLSIPGNAIKNASFTGSFDGKEIRKNDLIINNVKSSVKAENGIFHLNPLVMEIFGAVGEGDATIDKSNVETLYKLNLKVSKLDFEKLQQAYGLKKVIGGPGDLSVALAMKEKEGRRLMNSLEGSVSLRGEHLIIYNMDLDKVLSSYETSQEFNLVDLGTFFIAGPLGSFAVRAYNYGELYHQTRGGQGTITHFNSHWKIENGVAEATDCALATQRHRIALTGKLDLVRERYDNVKVALLDDQGCAKFTQGISGSFQKPRSSGVSAAESFAGPFSNFYGKVKRFVLGGKCEVIYTGSVQQPSGN